MLEGTESYVECWIRLCRVVKRQGADGVCEQQLRGSSGKLPQPHSRRGRHHRLIGDLVSGQHGEHLVGHEFGVRQQPVGIRSPIDASLELGPRRCGEYPHEPLTHEPYHSALRGNGCRQQAVPIGHRSVDATSAIFGREQQIARTVASALEPQSTVRPVDFSGGSHRLDRLRKHFLNFRTSTVPAVESRPSSLLTVTCIRPFLSDNRG